MCITPIILWNRSSSSCKNTFENSDLEDRGLPPVPRKEVVYDPSPVVDHHLPFRLVPCGKCLECCKKRKNEWYVRLRRQIECAAYKQVYWITLTFSDVHLPDNIPDLSLLMRRWKDVLRKRYGYCPDHWFITERGDDDAHTKRLHLHGFLMFSKDRPSYDELKSCWKYGFMWVQELNSLKGITYSMKYVFKNAIRRLKGDKLVSKIYASFGIGAAALSSSSYRLTFDRDLEWRPSENFGTRYSYPLPRYMLDKLCKMAGAKPMISPNSLLAWLLGPKPPRCQGLLSWIDHRMRTIFNKRSYSYSRYVANIYRAVFELIAYYPELQSQYQLNYV